MPLYSFLKITDNDNSRDFTIECTSMRNPQSRMSCLRSNLFAWEDAGCTGKWRPIWGYFFKDYSCYVCERKEFENLQSARAYRLEVHDRYAAKHN